MPRSLIVVSALLVVAAVLDLPRCPAQEASFATGNAMNAHMGTWVRERPGLKTMMTFTERRLKLTVELSVPEQKGVIMTQTFWVDADYTLGANGTVYGEVTGIDITIDGHMTSIEEQLKVMGTLQQYVGEIFRFRMAIENGELSLRDVKYSMIEADKSAEPVQMFLGAVQGSYTASASNGASAVQPVAYPQAPPKPTRMQQFHAAPPMPAPSHMTPERIHGGISSSVPVPSETVIRDPAPETFRPGFRITPVRSTDVLAPVPPLEVAPRPRTARMNELQPPPSDAAVLEAIRSRENGNARNLDNVTIVKNRIKSQLHPPRMFPNIGMAQLEIDQWECVVYYTESINENGQRRQQPRVSTVYIDQDRLLPVTY